MSFPGIFIGFYRSAGGSAATIGHIYVENSEKQSTMEDFMKIQGQGRRKIIKSDENLRGFTMVFGEGEIRSI